MNTTANPKKRFWQEVRVSVRRTCRLALMTGLALAPLAAQAGQPFAWGANNSLQLGIDSSDPIVPRPNPITGLGDDVLALAGGRGNDNTTGYSLALKSDGRVWSWGNNRFGQLGDGGFNGRAERRPIPGLADIVAIDAGFAHNLALQADGVTLDGRVWAWGANSAGQLGIGNTAHSADPIPVPGLDRIVAVQAGGTHSLALKSDGTVWAWGNNRHGTTGTSTGGDTVLIPTQVEGISRVVAIAAGSTLSLALDLDGALWAWGLNTEGQLAHDPNTVSTSATPLRVRGIEGVVVDIAAGGRHGMALTEDGSVWTWGSNLSGQLGIGDTPSESPTPVKINLTHVVAMSANDTHSMALRSDGTVRAWGDGGFGALGDGTREIRTLPVAVSGLGGVTRIAAAPEHSLAITKVVLSLNPASLSFGDQAAGAASASKSIAVSNPGTEDLVLSDITIVGNHPADFAVSSETCSGAPVAPGEACSIEVRCQPTALGARTATLRFKNNDAAAGQQVPLSCTGIKTAGDLGISLGDSPDPVKRNANLTYTATVQYRGTAAGSGQMNLNLPEGVSLVSASMSQGSCLYPAPAATGTVSCSTGSIVSGGSATFRIVTKVGVRGKSTLSATASVIADGFTEDSNSTNNSVAVSTNVFGSKK